MERDEDVFFGDIQVMSVWPEYAGMQYGAMFSLTLGPKDSRDLRGNFSTCSWRVKYEKMKPLNYGPILHFHHIALVVL